MFFGQDHVFDLQDFLVGICIEKFSCLSTFLAEKSQFVILQRSFRFEFYTKWIPENAVVLEEVAAMALGTLQINPQQQSISQILLDKHYLRKHGKDAYYGQKKD